MQTLEAHRVAFTGATSGFYEPSHEAMKAACQAEGINTPAYYRLPRAAGDSVTARQLF